MKRKTEIQNKTCLILYTFSHESWRCEILIVPVVLQGSSHPEGGIAGAILDALGPLLPFLDRDSLALVDKRALALRLEEMRSFCLPKEALRDISSLLTQTELLG